MENIRTFKPYKVRRVEGFSNRYQVCVFGLIDGIEVLPGTVSSAQEFADVLNDMNKEVQLHV